MKAVAIDMKSGAMSLEEMDEPARTAPTDVLVRMLEVGVCGTDAAICDGDDGEPPDGSAVLVPGHEGLGQVLEVGGDVDGLAPGDLVVPTVRRACPHGHCTACRTGNSDFCMTGDFRERGIRRAHGFLAERIVEDAAELCRVPAGLRDVAVLTEPLSIAEKGVRQYLAIQRRLPWLSGEADDAILRQRPAVVLGAGPISMLGAMLLRLLDVQTVVYSRSEPPAPEAEIARAIGAEYVSSEQEDFAALAERAGGFGFAYEGTGSAALMFEVLPALERNAVFMATGVPDPEGSEEIAADRVMNRLVLANQVLCGTVNSSKDDFRSAIAHLDRMLERWPDQLRGLITHRHEPDHFCDGAASDDGLKHVIRMDGSSPS